jgi:hypothetical protein
MGNNLLKSKTDESLLDALAKSVKQKRTSEEAEAQKVSFIFSAMDKESGVTKQRIREVLAE